MVWTRSDCCLSLLTAANAHSWIYHGECSAGGADCIIPGLYAMAGAVAVLGSIARMGGIQSTLFSNLLSIKTVCIFWQLPWWSSLFELTDVASCLLWLLRCHPSGSVTPSGRHLRYFDLVQISCDFFYHWVNSLSYRREYCTFWVPILGQQGRIRSHYLSSRRYATIRKEVTGGPNSRHEKFRGSRHFAQRYGPQRFSYRCVGGSPTIPCRLHPATWSFPRRR